MGKSTKLTSLTVGVTALTASKTLNQTEHAGRLISLNAAAGLTITLPPATGSGDEYELFIGTTVTSNNYVFQVASASDVLSGSALVSQDAADTAVMFETGATDDTVTMNGTTTGGLLGTTVRVRDVASGVFSYFSSGAATGIEATPFSAAV